MRRKTVLVVPATVPDAQVTRFPSAEPAPTVISPVTPAGVPTADPVPVIPDQPTGEQVAALRRENADLRDELERTRRR